MKVMMDNKNIKKLVVLQNQVNAELKVNGGLSLKCSFKLGRLSNCGNFWGNRYFEKLQSESFQWV